LLLLLDGMRLLLVGQPWTKDERALGFRPRPEASWAVAAHGSAVARWLGQGRRWASTAAQGVHGQRRRRALQREMLGPSRSTGGGGTHNTLPLRWGC